MVLIIHGFLDDIAALKVRRVINDKWQSIQLPRKGNYPSSVLLLQFEWAWQHPERSRHLRNCSTTKKPHEQTFLFNLRVLAEMLSVGPWNRLPLTIQWLVPSFEKPFPVSNLPGIINSILCKKEMLSNFYRSIGYLPSICQYAMVRSTV